MDENGKIYNLSIYLLKEKVKDFKSALKDLSVKEYKVKESFNIEGAIFIGKPKSRQAQWQDLLQEAIEEPLPSIDSTSNRALLLVKIDERIYALPFGYGKHILKDDVIDRDIALKTALNMIDANSLRSLDRANLDNLSIFTKTQSSSKAKQESFNVDPIKDLLKGVTGGANANNELLGSNITGNDGIYLNPTITFKDIKPILELIKAATKSKKYQSQFDWIDNLKLEKDPALIEILQAQLLQDLRNNDTIKVVLAPHMIIRWEVFEGVSYTPKGELQQDFSMEAFYKLNKKEITDNWEYFQTFRVYFKLSDQESAYKIPFWRCLNYETVYKDFLYVLMDGTWYKIYEKYADDIKNYAKYFEDSDLPFIDCDEDMDEDLYNKSLVASDSRFGLMDKKLVKTDLLRSHVEVCDVISSSKELIHIKFYRDSAGLSHLFSQGRISANLLMKDDTFRKNVRTKLNNLGLDRDLFPLKRTDFFRSDYTITFAIIDEKTRSFVETLPFFSLLNFRLVAEELSNWGYKVKVKKINIS